MMSLASTIRHLRGLKRDERGVTIVEFAIVAPVLLLMMVGAADLGLQVYGRAILDGAMQQAGRDSALEPGGPTAAELDAMVSGEVQKLLPNATVTFSRRNYQNYADIGVEETFTDSNSDGRCNDGEPFEDMNGNGRWDADVGRDGQGGARDAVLYEANVAYTRMLPIHSFVSTIEEDVVLTSATILRNQPYSDQGQRTAEVGYCT